MGRWVRKEGPIYAGVTLCVALFALLMWLFLSCGGTHTVTLGVEVCGIKAEVEWCYMPGEAPPPKEVEVEQQNNSGRDSHQGRLDRTPRKTPRSSLRWY